MEEEVFSLLADGCFHSGQIIGERIGISRAAVWKIVERLRCKGASIHAVPGRGYRLAYPVELLDAASITANFPPLVRSRVSQLDVLFATNSTNQQVAEMAFQVSGIAICCAEYQYAGRGRGGRSWTSTLAGNINMSLLYEIVDGPTVLMGLGLAVALGVRSVIAKIGLVDALIKWPNDIVVAGHKLAGILLEVKGEVAGPCQVIIGLGVNCRMNKDIIDQIDQPCTDLYRHLGDTFSRNKLVAELAASLVETINEFHEHGFAHFQPRWREVDATYGAMLTLHTSKGSVSGIGCGIDSTGALLVRGEKGMQRYFTGDVTLRLQETENGTST